MSSLAPTWPGPSAVEARAAYERARSSGLTVIRSLVIGTIASFRDGYLFRSTIAGHIGCSVRTVQRAITEAKEGGLIGVARAKKGEIPPGMSTPLACGWSHRWTIGWGQAYEAAVAAVAQTRLARMVKAAVKGTPSQERTRRRWTAEEIDAQLDPPMQGPHQQQQREPRRWTAEELDAELERFARAQAPP